MQKTILVTGGLGYIGSHTSVTLAQLGYKVIIFDNLYNAKLTFSKNIRSILSEQENANLHIVVGDVTKAWDLEQVFEQYQIDQVIHFAALKAVGESVAFPLKYYQNNVGGLQVLLACMEKYQVHDLIFSSTATVYGNNPIPCREDALISRAANPYGQSKITCEYMLEDAVNSSKLRAIRLRYFNPVGAHPSGKIGEEYARPFNIFPALYDVYLGKQEQLTIFGTDYPTADGTAERDYIHIMDLVHGHIKALHYLDNHPEENNQVFNLGTGHPYSVKQVVEAFITQSDRPIKVVYGPRRPGDLPTSYAATDKSEQVLGFKAQYGLEQMCRDAFAYLKYKLAQQD
ncbi:UDP-glucose 4-epimerase GalE [Psittacicella melopsittaci]|uniref:UDP-glucose 4-epimerase n=1 Tax=Psittacicella melopsittaci TaxID=2028576 RepID=A0A3A1Y566_9GAMM|nr:UDP-glucose 4-epimerase GalE [Psittacicella melopsittaci]RIY32725.1 UDP-glucose 4-epimerase GalE [Psittacicella melopsittaci]